MKRSEKQVGKSIQSREYAKAHGIEVIELKMITRVFIVVEQYPHKEIACFRAYDDANDFVAEHRSEFALPLVVSFELPAQSRSQFLKKWVL